nr:PaaI family thioesterase [Geodermatophilus sabuli]
MPGLSERVEPGCVVLTARPDARFGNHDGMMHGGVQVALADAALHAAAREAGGGEPALIDMTVRYMRPIPVDGSTIELQATVERAGRLVTVTRARGSDEQGRLLMTAEATFSSARRVRMDE